MSALKAHNSKLTAHSSLPLSAPEFAHPEGVLCSGSLISKCIWPGIAVGHPATERSLRSA